MADGDKLLYTGALLFCDKGCLLTTFTASIKKYHLYGPFVGTTIDNKPCVNIPLFGACAMKKGSPCFPPTLTWTKFHNGALKIEKAFPLLVTSECKCPFGGTIRIFDTRAAAAAAQAKKPNGKEKERLKKALNDLNKRDAAERAKAAAAEQAKLKKCLAKYYPPQKKEGAFDDLKETWKGMKSIAKASAVVVISDVAYIKGGDKNAAEAAVKSAGKKIGVDLHGTQKSIDSALDAFSNLDAKTKLKMIGEAAGSMLDGEPGEMVSGVGGLAKIEKSAKAIETAEKMGKKAEEIAEKAQKAKELAEKLRAAKIAKAQKAVEEQKTTKGIMRVKNTKKYTRNKGERTKALLRDAKDPKSQLSPEARKQILVSKGQKVPKGYEVSHKEPLFTRTTTKGKQKLDKASNMETISKSAHRNLHKCCGYQYHRYGPSNKPKNPKP